MFQIIGSKRSVGAVIRELEDTEARMHAHLEQRRRNFFQGLPFILFPAILIVPALRFVSICPPSYGQRLAISIAIAIAASELWGVIHMFKCFVGKCDLTAMGAIFGAAVGGVVLLFMLFVGVLAMHPR